MKIAPIAILVAGLAALSAAQDKVTPVKEGSAERKAIVEAFRPMFRKQVANKPVIFRIEYMRMQKGFAFVRFWPLKPDGKDFDYHGTKFQQEIDDGFFDGGCLTLLKKVNGKWKALDMAIGPTDVAWEPWPKKYHAPAELMGLPPKGY